MQYEVLMPKLGHEMESGVVEAWFKQVGDTVERGEVLAEITTDKTNVEMESLHSGVLTAIAVPAGCEVTVGQVIAYIEGD